MTTCETKTTDSRNTQIDELSQEIMQLICSKQVTYDVARCVVSRLRWIIDRSYSAVADAAIVTAAENDENEQA